MAGCWAVVVAALVAVSLLPIDAAPLPSTVGPSVSTIAGNGTQASVDGVGTTAALSQPWGVSLGVTSPDDIYFAEFGGARIQNGTRCADAGFHCMEQNKNPECMIAPGRHWQKPINSCDCGCDTFYYTGSGHRIRAVKAGKLITVAGSGLAGFRDGDASQAQFNHPYGVATIASSTSKVDDVVVADGLNHRVRVIRGDTGKVETLAGSGLQGHGNGVGAAAAFNFPTDVAVHTSGAILVADRLNNCIRRITAQRVVETVAGVCGELGFKDGPGAEALFNAPTSLAVDGDVLYVSDMGNHLVRVVDLGAAATANSTVSSVSVSTLSVAHPSADPLAVLSMPSGLAWDAATKTLYCANYRHGTIVAFSHVDGAKSQSQDRVAGNGQFSFAQGPALQSSFRGPKGLAWDAPNKRLLVGDWYNHRLRAVSSLPQPLPLALNASTPVASAVRMMPMVSPPPVSAAAFAAPAAAPPISVLVWTGHSGPFHDHFTNGQLLAEALNASSAPIVAYLGSEESDFETRLGMFDVLIIMADTYENPNRGSLTSEQWQGLFSFVANGGGLFALHTASACWMNNETNSVKFHHELLNCEFGGHSPYKDFYVTVPGSTGLAQGLTADPQQQNDPITHGIPSYVVTDELYHPTVYDPSRSTVFLTAYDAEFNETAVHGLRHSYKEGRVLYFAQGHNLAEYYNPVTHEGNAVFELMVERCIQWLAKRA